MTEELKKIKYLYGEKMAKLCRELFPSLLEQKNFLLNIITSKFAFNHYLYEDIIEKNLEEEFKNYIYSFVDVEQDKILVNKSVSELLSLAGYNFYECHTEDDIQSFRKYYQVGEELCTFKGGRLNKCYVFWAIKKDVNNIKREDFPLPSRQDEYGTSVISIQFSKGEKNTVSIKNRYNHKVNNPDATFSNNLENIIPGLTDAFERDYGFNISNSLGSTFVDLLGNYDLGNDGKYYRRNHELNNISYCQDNVIIDNGEVIKLDKSRYLLIDYFIIDLKEKKIKLYDEMLNDSFANSFDEIEKILIEKNKSTNTKKVIISQKGKTPVIVEINKYGEIISVKDENIIEIENQYLYINKTLTNIDIRNVKKIGTAFLSTNTSLREINCENVIEIKDSFLFNNNALEDFNCGHLERVGKNFMRKNRILKKLSCPLLTSMGDFALQHNEIVELSSYGNLKNIGVNCSKKIQNYINKGGQDEKVRSSRSR